MFVFCSILKLLFLDFHTVQLLNHLPFTFTVEPLKRKHCTKMAAWQSNMHQMQNKSLLVLVVQMLHSLSHIWNRIKLNYHYWWLGWNFSVVCVGTLDFHMSVALMTINYRSGKCSLNNILCVWNRLKVRRTFPHTTTIVKLICCVLWKLFHCCNWCLSRCVCQMDNEKFDIYFNVKNDWPELAMNFCLNVKPKIKNKIK